MPKFPSMQAAPPATMTGRPEVLLRRAARAETAGNRDEAIRLYRLILTIDPLDPNVTNALGVALAQNDQLLEAIRQFDDTLRLAPDEPVAWINRGLALEKTGRMLEAMACFDRVVALRPDHPSGYHARSGILFHLGRFEEALAVHDQIGTMPQNDAGLLTGRATILRTLGRTDEAFQDIERALSIDRSLPFVWVDKSTLLLLTGDLAAGFKLFEWRAQLPDMKKFSRSFEQPLWLGETDIAGKTILLYSEQGMGDTIQFCRYAPLAAKAGARVILQVEPPLREVMTTLPGVTEILTLGDPLPDFDVQCPMMSLPLAFGTTLDTIPVAVPYLSAAPDRVAVWRDRLSGLEGRRIGLVWGGSSRFGNASLVSTDQRRSVPLTALAPLAAVPGCVFVSLQLGPPAAQASAPPAGMVLHDHSAHLTDFAETAALIENLDLVIGVDTSTPHLAAAMGKPVWLLNRFDTCWRWLLDREDTPWYPTMRIFRQPRSGDWASVARAVADALRSGSAP